ncbi:Mth938-like domain-containing protein [Tropicimonas sediminicola]|uniref:Uncharacterized conserved protein, contains Mth938-like domain n=1 Tax=Tropicimonas sediminicola TaxID=1031541 RepID=A0A239HKY2_9RHOB|nr:Mth938-like domain-containing protein [Tropicimonas sediminicola]SNS82056.1 Uncharacterized conserved protein, contains Mth938-like domain [Tropicimonas sediminicola]
MEFIEVEFPDAVPFEGYGPGFFRIGGEVRQGDLLVTARSLRGWGGYGDAEAVLALAGEIDFVIVGTGAEMAAIPGAFRRALEEAGIGVELMATATACRTYNVLVSEGRRVAAAVLAL